MNSTVAEAPHREPLLDTTQAAERMGIARQTAAVWRVKGFGPPHILMGRKILYDPADIDAWIEANRHNSTSDRASA
jgi:predicted DNA-binding transcriptional regulator AlpA